MKKLKTSIISITMLCFFITQGTSIFANQNLIQENQKTIIGEGDPNHLVTVYLDGSKETSGSGKTQEDAVNNLEKALELVRHNGSIIASGTISVNDNITFPNKYIVFEGNSKTTLHFKKNIYLNNMLFIKNTNVIFDEKENGAPGEIILNGNFIEFDASSIKGKPNVYMGSEQGDIENVETTASIRIINNTEKTILSNIYMGGKGNYKSTIAIAYLENTIIEGIIDGTNVTERSRFFVPKDVQVNEVKGIQQIQVDTGSKLSILSKLDHVRELRIYGEIKVKNGAIIDTEYIYGKLHLNIDIPQGESLKQGNYICYKKLNGEIVLVSELTNKGYAFETIDSPKGQAIEVFDKNNKLEQNHAPVIKNLKPIILREGTRFDVKENISAWDIEDGDLTNQIIYPTTILEDLPVGKHQITYEVTDRNHVKTIMHRDVYVIKNAFPIIKGVNDITLKVSEVDNFDLRKGVIFHDDKDQNLTLSVEGSLGKPRAGTKQDYQITYTVIDSDQHKTSLTRTITVTNYVPKITGLNKIVVKKGAPIDLLKDVQAYDHEDGDLTKSIKITGDYDTNHIGSRTLTYQVSDYDGNLTQETRALEVINKKQSTIQIDSNLNQTYTGMMIQNPHVTTTGSNGNVHFQWEQQNQNKWISMKQAPIHAGTYRVTAHLEGNDEFDSASSQPVIFTIQQAKPNFIVPTNLTAYVGQQLSDITLPEGFHWQDPSSLVGEIGTNTFFVSYVPKDTINYETVTNIEVSITVKKHTNQSFVIHANNQTITIGTTFDPLNNVYITNKENKKWNISNENVIYNDVNSSKIGVYHVTYQIKDYNGDIITKTITVTVVSDSTQSQVPQSSNHIPTGVSSNPIFYAFLLISSICILIFYRKHHNYQK